VLLLFHAFQYILGNKTETSLGWHLFCLPWTLFIFCHSNKWYIFSF
jgi:hypothetical protein